ncbi:MAG: HupE/UreJ family protein [Synechococcus sp.]
MPLPLNPSPRRQLLLPVLAGLGCAALSALPAQAHGGAGGGVTAGLLHPLLGLDHLLLWLGLGALGSLAGRRWLLWGGGGGAVGVVLGSLGVSLPLAEPLAGLAVTLLGLLLVLLISRGTARAGASTDLPLGGLVAGCCAIHGLLHGAEGSGGTGWWLGLLVSSLALVATGRFGFPLLAGRWQPRLALGLAASGLVLTGLALN